MQETEYKISEEESKRLMEFFKGSTDSEVMSKMDKRLDELQEQKYTLIQRVKIGRNDLCPCGSGLKFKKCCISKVV